MTNTVVPVLDFSEAQSIPITGDNWKTTDGQVNLAQEMINAFKTVGFVCLTHTGLDQTQMDHLMSEVKEFFKQDTATKAKYTKGVMSNVGWTDVGRETLNPQVKAGDYKETFNFQPNMDPSGLPDSMKGLGELWKVGSELATRVMKLIALGLGLDDPNVIANSHNFGATQNESAIRVNFYPATAGKQLLPNQVRCGEHTDYGSVTLLFQDSQGLQVMNKSTGCYEDVVAPPGGIVVNIGDALQFWTSDVLVANKHRVLVAEDEELQSMDRVSVPFFAMPDQTINIKCLIGQDKYEPVLMGDWLKMKIDSAFKERQAYSTTAA